MIGMKNVQHDVRRCLNRYVKVLLNMNIPSVEDLRLRRNWPRVLKIIANYGCKVMKSWIGIASDERHPLLGSRSWEEETINEEWEGDTILPKEHQG